MSRNSNAHAAKQRSSIAATDASSHVAFARSTGLPLSMGKSTSVIKAAVPDCVAEDLARMAREAGVTVSDFLRDMVMVRLYGIERVSSMQRRRLELATGIGQERDPR